MGRTFHFAHDGRVFWITVWAAYDAEAADPATAAPTGYLAEYSEGIPGWHDGQRRFIHGTDGLVARFQTIAEALTVAKAEIRRDRPGAFH